LRPTASSLAAPDKRADLLVGDVAIVISIPVLRLR
jgi:hypothetical protein